MKAIIVQHPPGAMAEHTNIQEVEVTKVMESLIYFADFFFKQTSFRALALKL